MYPRYTRDLALWLLAIIFGPLAYWLLPRDMEAGRPRGKGGFHWRWADRIWGNEMDGLSGDAGYYRDHVNAPFLRYRDVAWYLMPLVPVINAHKAFQKRFPCFVWACVRNPANNLARHIGPSGIINYVRHKGHLHIYTLHNGKRFFFYYTPDKLLMWKIGYKAWPDSYTVGKHFDGAIAFSLQRGQRGRKDAG